MALPAYKTWVDGETLIAADLNGAFTSILNNALTLISPLTGTLDCNGNSIALDADTDLLLNASTDDVAQFVVGSGFVKFNLSAAAAVDGIALHAAAAGDPVRIDAEGATANIDIEINSKGGGGHVYLDEVDILFDERINQAANPQFRFWQRFGPTVTSTSSANNDDTFFCDRWIVLSDGNDIVDLTRETSTIPSRSTTCLKADVETGDKKFGFLQILDQHRSAQFRGVEASLRFAARVTGTSISNVRAAILYWDSTADSVTSDVVSAWGAAGTNPTLVANWNYAQTPVDNGDLTTSFANYTVEDASVPTNASNVAIFIWIDDVTVTIGDFFFLGEVGLYRASSAPNFQYVGPAEDLRECQRFYEKTFSVDVAPGNATDDANGSLNWTGTTANVPTAVWKFASPKRAVPTITMYNYRNAGTDGQWDNGAASMANARAIDTNTFGVRIDNTSTVASASAQWFIHATADAEL